MFCSNCGNPLSSTDKFCSNCGTPVEREEKPEDTMFKSEEPGNLQEENEEIKLEPPSEKFDWNVHTFPGTEPHPTEDINFDWHMGDDDFQREPKGEESPLRRSRQKSAVPKLGWKDLTLRPF